MIDTNANKQPTNTQKTKGTDMNEVTQVVESLFKANNNKLKTPYIVDFNIDQTFLISMDLP